MPSHSQSNKKKKKKKKENRSVSPPLLQTTQNHQEQTGKDENQQSILFNTETFPPLSKLMQSKRQKQKKVTNITQLFGVDFPTSSKSDTLHEGEIYDAVVVGTLKHCFVVSIAERFPVIVFPERFEGTRNQPNVPIPCLVAVGDTVVLTVQRRKDHAKHVEEWMAVECWQEADGVPTQVFNPQSGTVQRQVIGDRETVHKGSVSATFASYVRLGSSPDIVVARRECTFLYGYCLAKVDLTEVFNNGDEFEYELDVPPTTGVDGLPRAKRAWYGSMSRTDEQEPTELQTMQCMDFCVTRNILKVYRILVVSSVDKEAPAVSGDESDLEYIEPAGQRRKHKRKKPNRSTQITHLIADACYMEPPETTRRATTKNVPVRNRREPEKKTNETVNGDKTPCKSEEVKRRESKDTHEQTSINTANIQVPSKPNSVLNKLDTVVETVDVATQTYATGDVFSFFSIYHAG